MVKESPHGEVLRIWYRGACGYADQNRPIEALYGDRDGAQRDCAYWFWRDWNETIWREIVVKKDVVRFRGTVRS